MKVKYEFLKHQCWLTDKKTIWRRTSMAKQAMATYSNQLYITSIYPLKTSATQKRK
jgi:hypothetical protein